jgi:hypothetical protein
MMQRRLSRHQPHPQEALNNQGFSFAIPDAIVTAIIGVYLILQKHTKNIKIIYFFFDRSRCTTTTNRNM